MANIEGKLNVLIEYAKFAIEAHKKVLEAGEDIVPKLLTVNSRGEGALHVLMGEMDADERNLIIRQIVEEQDAEGFAHSGDCYIWDQTHTKLLGEQLLVIIQIKGHPQLSTVVTCRYTRDPLKFEEVKVRREEGFVRPIWDEDHVKH